MSDSKITNQILLDMMGTILVEIRAHSNPKYGKVMSDVFHNVPARLIRSVAPDQIYEDMVRVAKRHNMEGYLAKLLEHSLKKDFKNGDAEKGDNCC